MSNAQADSRRREAGKADRNDREDFEKTGRGRTLKVVGRNRTVYEYGVSGKKDTDGTEYQIKNRKGYMLKLLGKAYCTKAKEQEINSALSTGNTWHGRKLQDMVYSHGKFVGIVYDEVVNTPLEKPPITPPERPAGYNSGEHRRKAIPPANPHSSTDFFDNGFIKAGYAAGAGVLLSLLTRYVLFEVYVSLIASMFSEEMADKCYSFNFSGITGIIGGVIGLGVMCKIMFGNGGIMYYIMCPVGFLAGMAFAFIIVTAIIGLLNMVYSLFIALIPVLIIIGGIILALRSVFGGRRN